MARVVFLPGSPVTEKISERITAAMTFKRCCEQHFVRSPVEFDAADEIERFLANTRPTATILDLTGEFEETATAARIVQRVRRFPVGLIVSPRAWNTVRDDYDPSWCLFVAPIRKVRERIENCGSWPPECPYLGDDESPSERPIRKIASLLDRLVSAAPRGNACDFNREWRK